VKAEWKNDEGIYDVEVRYAEGNIRKDWCNALINCSGVLNNWKCPDIPGREAFKGEMVHSASWNPNTDCTGNKVAVIGIGSSGIQILLQMQKSTLPYNQSTNQQNC
jgi:cation diffusion facilitator CzcD-associated flavoprotein CzcO